MLLNEASDTFCYLIFSILPLCGSCWRIFEQHCGNLVWRLIRVRITVGEGKRESYSCVHLYVLRMHVHVYMTQEFSIDLEDLMLLRTLSLDIVSQMLDIAIVRFLKDKQNHDSFVRNMCSKTQRSYRILFPGSYCKVLLG